MSSQTTPVCSYERYSCVLEGLGLVYTTRRDTGPTPDQIKKSRKFLDEF